MGLNPVEKVRQWKADPAQMVRDLFHVEPDRWQLDGLKAFADPTQKRIAFQACVGVGKSTMEAWCGWNFLLCYGDPANGHYAEGLVTSMTGENLRDGLWKELGVWYARSELLQRIFVMTGESIRAREQPKLWFLNARTWSKKANADEQGRSLSGLHSAYILYLLDESGSTAPSVLKAAEQGLSNCTWGKIVQGGNPADHNSVLHESVTTQAHLWTVLRVTGDPADPKRSPRVPLDFAQQQIDLYGRENPWVMAFILGLFPPTSMNALLGPDDVAKSMGKHLREDEYSFMQKRIGVDVARFGDDSTILFPRQGLAAMVPVKMRNARTEEIAARLMLGKSRFKSEMELIDDTGGWAAGVIDACRLGGVNLMPINFAGKADDPRYFNKRSEMHFRAAEWVKGGGALPNVPEIRREAVAPTYWFENGKMRVAEKDQIKKELQGHSPDYWDAFCLTFAIADMPASDSPEALVRGTGNNTQTEWDPFSERDSG